MGPLTAMKCPSSEPVSTMVPTPLFSVILDRMSSPRLPSTRLALASWGQVEIHAYELEDLLPAGDEAGAKHVVDAEGLRWRGGRRGGVVHNVRELLLQLQIVQNEAVAVVGYAEAVRGLAIGSSSEVGADPGCQPSGRSVQRKLSAILIL